MTAWDGTRASRPAAPATAEELAKRTGTHPRYAREWLEQQAVTGLLSAETGNTGRRFALPPAAAEVLTNRDSLSYLAPLARQICAAAKQLPALLAAYRDGGGVGWTAYGADAREGQADLNRPWFAHALAPALSGVPALDRVLRSPGTRIADIGCGGGWSTIALARTYPDATVDGYDIDRASVDLARANAAGSGNGDRLSFHAGDAALLPVSTYHAVFCFECVHDLARPVEVLTAARESLVPGGSVIVMDEAVADHFTAPGDDVERLMYAFSILICLPDGMSHSPSAGTGTAMRTSTLRAYAEKAGFAKVEILPITEFGFWRFSHLTV